MKSEHKLVTYCGLSFAPRSLSIYDTPLTSHLMDTHIVYNVLQIKTRTDQPWSQHSQPQLQRFSSVI